MKNKLVVSGWEEPYIIKNMDKFLWDPKDLKELLDAIEKLPKEKFYDLHYKELNQIHFGLYLELSKNSSEYSRANDGIRSKLFKLFDFKENTIKILNILSIAIANLDTEYFDIKSWSEQEVFEKKSKIMFFKILHLFDQNKKIIDLDLLDILVSDKYLWNIDQIGELRFDFFAKILKFILRSCIYNSSDKLDLALSNILKLHGEDISRPLLWWRDIENKTRNSILFTQYGFALIDIDQLIVWLKANLQTNKQQINNLIKPFLWIYDWLKIILEHTNSESSWANIGKIPFSKIPTNINTDQIDKLFKENTYLQTIINADRELLISKLEILRNIFDCSLLSRLTN